MKLRSLAVALSATFLLAACGGTPAENPGTQEPSAPTSSATETTPAETTPAEASTADAIVFAAASLNAVFPEIAEAKYSFDGSSGLVDQMLGGAPADVFASADQKNMDKAVDAGLIDGDPALFATNYLVLVTPADNPAGITGFDASLDGTKLVICAADVPCGAATLKAAEANGLTLTPVSEEAKVTDVLGKVTSGEADAGLVYATDATGAGDAVTVFDVPGAKEDPNTYWIAAVKDAPNAEAAAAFIDAIMSEEGQSALAGFGFGPAQ
ncbi:MAG TPA: molybdate ABC transporter substrate-binding protein [Arachnia sp.]|nr:molybdate ABC transporter substrate-binding protein [Arachnia sp.]HMT86178.1 molybdate ABC transporter substrate-binding protein [Arachnia sp.]